MHHVSHCFVSYRSNSSTWCSARRSEHTADWRVLVSRHSSCTAPDTAYKTSAVVVAAAAAVADGVDVVKERMRFAECSRCLEERCRKTCL